jgi:hypothetical protein
MSHISEDNLPTVLSKIIQPSLNENISVNESKGGDSSMQSSFNLQLTDFFTSLSNVNFYKNIEIFIKIYNVS